MPRTEVTISATEVPQFERLVRFLEDVAGYAELETDLELRQLVEDCRSDLLEHKRGPDP
jgi:hypothetical protein